jgi:hypothetical protein
MSLDSVINTLDVGRTREDLKITNLLASFYWPLLETVDSSQLYEWWKKRTFAKVMITLTQTWRMLRSCDLEIHFWTYLCKLGWLYPLFRATERELSANRGLFEGVSRAVFKWHFICCFSFPVLRSLLYSFSWKLTAKIESWSLIFTILHFNCS